RARGGRGDRRDVAPLFRAGGARRRKPSSGEGRHVADDDGIARAPRRGDAGYIAAEIYYRCARHDDAGSGAPDAAAKRAQFQATVARAGSQADTRAAAYARLDGSSACAGLDFGAYDAKAYAEMLRASADAGYAAASARLLADRIVRDTNVAQQSANHGSGY